MGVKHLDLFNISLLGKWRWRFLVDKEACWYSILNARYVGLMPREGEIIWNSRNSSQWWRDIQNLDYEKSAPCNRFSNAVSKKVGNGKNTRFWQEVWFGDRSLKEAFPRMFSLASEKHSLISDLGCWDGGRD